MPDTLLPDPAEPHPAATVLRRERTRWIRHEADFNQRHAADLGNVADVARGHAHAAYLVLTFALAGIEGQPHGVGSFEGLVGQPLRPDRPDQPGTS